MIRFMRRIQTYARVYQQCARLSLGAFAAYRANFFLHFFVDTLWVLLNIIFIETIFQHTSVFAGWDRGEMYILFAFFQTEWRVFNFFFRNNLIAIPDIITNGSLDLLLTRPLSPVFLLSVRQVHYKALVNLIFPAFLFWYGFSFLFVSPSFLRVTASIVSLGAGVMIGYAVLFIIETFSFWFLQISNVYYLYEYGYRIARFPLDIYGKAKVIFFSVFPIAFAAYVPAGILLGKMSASMVWYACGMAVLFVWAASRFWRFASQWYASAGG